MSWCLMLRYQISIQSGLFEYTQTCFGYFSSCFSPFVWYNTSTPVCVFRWSLSWPGGSVYPLYGVLCDAGRLRCGAEWRTPGLHHAAHQHHHRRCKNTQRLKRAHSLLKGKHPHIDYEQYNSYSFKGWRKSLIPLFKTSVTSTDPMTAELSPNYQEMKC